MEHMLSVLDQHYRPGQRVAQDSSGSLTVADLQQGTAVMAAALKLLKIKVLALQADNGIPWLIIDLACQQAGICLLPIPDFFSNQQLKHVLSTAAVDALVCQHPENLERILAGRIRASCPFQPGNLLLAPPASPRACA